MRLELPETTFTRHYADSLRHQLVVKTRLPLVCSRIINSKGVAVYRIARLPALETPNAR